MTQANPPEIIAASATAPQVGEVHLWRADLDTAAFDPTCLEADEAARAARFVSAVHSRRFAAGRALLRGVLARYLNLAPVRVRFAYAEHGRPSVLGAPFDFNLSHTEGDFLLAVAGDRVGLDIERRAREADLLGLAARVMTPGELAAFVDLRPGARRSAFYDLWTRKEAVMKLLGTGFSRDARTLEVGWTRDSCTEDGQRITLNVLDVDPGLAATLASYASLSRISWRV